MAKVRLDFKKFDARVKTQLGAAIKKSKVDLILKDELIKEVRKGNQPKGGNLKAINEPWISRREKLKQANAVHPDYRKGKSNLTFTGELLDKGFRSTTIVSKQLIQVLASNKLHKNYKRLTRSQGGVPSKRKKGARKRSSYADIFDGQADQGRDVFEFGDNFLQRVANKIVVALKKSLNI